MAERGLITFTDGRDSFHVHMPVGGDVKTVAKALENIKFGNGHLVGAVDPGEVAAEFVKQQRASFAKTKLTPNTSKHLWDTDLVYNVNVRAVTVEVSEIRMGRAGVTPLYRGDAGRFYKWADASRELRDAIDKVVKFVYKGGSGTGERLVKLTGVEGNGKGTILRGWDIHKSSADNPAYRTYRIGNIVGDVEVVG